MVGSSKTEFGFWILSLEYRLLVNSGHPKIEDLLRPNKGKDYGDRIQSDGKRG